MMKNRLLVLVCFFLAVCLITACNKNSKKVDVSGIEVNLEVKRFEQDFFAIDTSNIINDLNDLEEAYPVFYPIYIEQIMRFGIVNDTSGRMQAGVQAFLANQYVQGLKDTVDDRFGDLAVLNQELTMAMKHWKYYYPNKPVPEIITFISEFGNGAANIDTTVIAIGLDLFLGKEYVYYESIFPFYMCQTLEPGYLTPNAMKALYNSYYEDPMMETRALIYEMIERGKQLYFLDCMLPETADHFKISFEEHHIEWCEASEKSIWQYFADHELFYEEDLMEVNRYLSPGPSTSGMPPESPANVGSWVGWQIVRAYMEQMGENVTLQEMILMDSQAILNGSKYKP